MAHPSEVQSTLPDVQALFAWNGGTFEFAERAYRSWLRGAETVQTHAMEYWNAELQKSIEAMNAMAQCQTPAEAFGVQTRYATEAMQGLMAEGQKVVEQLTAITQTPWAPALAARDGAAAEASTDDAAATTRRSSRRRS